MPLTHLITPTQVFKDHIKARRGSKIAGHEDVVFSGDFFTGQKGMELGLVDGIGSLQSVAKDKLGEKVKINYINARPRFPFFPGLGTAMSYMEGRGGGGGRRAWVVDGTGDGRCVGGGGGKDGGEAVAESGGFVRVFQGLGVKRWIII